MKRSPPDPGPMLRVLSLGAGVQSTTLALMAAHGEIEPPDCAIFADTGWEPSAIYDHLDWLETQLPFPVYRVQRGKIREDVAAHVETGIARTGKQHPQMPVWVATNDRLATPIMRTCTQRYKIDPIIEKLAALCGIECGRKSPKTPIVEQWIGISTDEAHRMKPARERWILHRWPLIEARMSRWDCLRWFERRYGSRKLAKSSCVGCPYHSDRHWREMKDNAPLDWTDAVTFDALIRRGIPGVRNTPYLHRSLRPLDQVDLSTAAERGQPDLFGNECEGMCGV